MEKGFWGLHNDGGEQHPVLKTEMLGKEVARWSFERKARSEQTLGARSLPPGVQERIPQTRKREGREVSQETVARGLCGTEPRQGQELTEQGPGGREQQGSVTGEPGRLPGVPEMQGGVGGGRPRQVGPAEGKIRDTENTCVMTHGRRLGSAKLGYDSTRRQDAWTGGGVSQRASDDGGECFPPTERKFETHGRVDARR